MKLVIGILLIALTGCGKFPTEPNRQAFRNSQQGIVTFDYSKIIGTHYEWIFKSIEHEVNVIIHNECVKDMLPNERNIDINQDSIYDFLDDNIKNTLDLHRYIVSQSVSPVIEIGETDKDALASSNIAFIVFNEDFMRTAYHDEIVMVTIHELMHVMGFRHDVEDTPKRGISTPYKMDYIGFICRNGP
jgi:hypothetical protein